MGHYDDVYGDHFNNVIYKASLRSSSRFVRGTWPEGTYVWIASVKIEDETEPSKLADAPSFKTWCMKNKHDGIIIGWQPCSQDLLANDWEELRK